MPTGGSVDAHASDIQIVIFRIGREQYALPTTTAREVIGYERPRTLPGADRWVEGVINLRGEIIPICDLMLALGLDVQTDRGQIIVCDAADGSIGLIVEEVTSVLTVATDTISHPRTLNHPALAGLIQFSEALVVLLDIENAMAGDPEARAAFEQARSLGAVVEQASAPAPAPTPELRPLVAVATTTTEDSPQPDEGVAGTSDAPAADTTDDAGSLEDAA